MKKWIRDFEKTLRDRQSIATQCRTNIKPNEIVVSIADILALIETIKQMEAHDKGRHRGINEISLACPIHGKAHLYGAFDHVCACGKANPKKWAIGEQRTNGFLGKAEGRSNG